jgi:hypothetical protein
MLVFIILRTTKQFQNYKKFREVERVGFYFFSSHTQELKYEPLHPLVVNGLQYETVAL